ncbi:DNA topoisomerase 2-binding protein 1-like [Neocloeon triangulifer]|uniref:DNA topoisomerase 2-binding protein 1-like n=1 Tax=Neocloeon triangulifer TaxID=2078957 RepID=UPI00286F1589|nr:DNA topoisomerase 2-binding protein 1-like [Neocloeon triangulifer]
MEQSFSQRGLRMYFVRQSEEPSKCFTDAFQSCQDKLIHPQMLDEEECEKLQVDRKVVLVLEKFEGQLFHRLFTESSPCTILGAPCVQQCLSKGEPTPEGPYPVFSLAMQGLRVCLSGFKPSQKEELANKVRFMCGTFEKNLSTDVTHLVAEMTNTEKYSVAVENKIPVMLETWVHESWETNQTNHLSALDDLLIRLKCPPFLGLIISVTQFPKAKKEKIRAIIEKHGGKYSPDLTAQETDVLVVSNTSGEKYRAAKEWKIPCVSEAWVLESAKAGHSLNFNSYAVKAPAKTSTPERDASQMDISMISTIAHEVATRNQATKINETMASTVSTMSFAEPLPPERREPPSTPEKEHDATMKIMKLPLAEVRKAGPFLDGCKIYVSGGSTALQDKLRKMLNSSGATRFDEISEGLTHVVLAGQSLRPAEAQALAQRSRKPPIVPLSWLIRSFELKHPAEAVGQQGPEPPSPLSKRGMQMFKSPQKLIISPRTAKNDLAVVQQYLDDDMPVPLPVDNAKNEEEDDEEELAQPMAALGNVKLQIKDLTKTEAALVRHKAESMGAKFVDSNADYIIGPFKTQASNPKQVTQYWLEECDEKGETVPIQYFHRPILLRPKKPLKGVVIAISSYGGQERAYLSTLAIELGAVYQDVFAKKPAPDRNAIASTHLICPTPEGSKFKAATKWHLPAVTKDWLLQCSVSNSHLPEEPFLLTGPTAPSPSASVLSASTSSIQKDDLDVGTPVRPPPNIDGFKTPFSPATPVLVQDNKLMDAERISRLSLASFRREVDKLDPGYISTPETPYGQVKSDDPSPTTRKAWKRYLNSIPDSKRVTDDSTETTLVSKRARVDDLGDEKLGSTDGAEVTIDIDLDDKLLENYSSQKNVRKCEDQNKENEEVPSTSAPYPTPFEDEDNTLQDVMDDEEEEEEEEPAEERPVYHFMLTGFAEKDLDQIHRVVNNLNGKVSATKMFDPEATHLVTNAPSRSERLLGAIAAGLWIVHPQFLLESAKAMEFLSEEDYEWGNPKAAGFLEPQIADSPLAQELAAACYRWRKTDKKGAFKDFKAILLGAPQKTAAFERMIIAGGGEVVPYKEENLSGVTHCFIDVNRVNMDLSALRSANVPCYNPIYLSDYLIKNPLPDSSVHRI